MMRMRLDRTDMLCAGFLFFAGACLCAQVLWSGEWGIRPVIEDEFVYLFQAKTLAAGRLSYPSPPLPEFFEAAHILVVPRFAGKYLPGHPAVMAPFVAAGLPWLAPCFLLGAIAALLFLCARAAGLVRAAAALAAALLLGSADAFHWFASYLSQTSSTAWVAAGILALLAVQTRPSAVRVAVLAVCVAAAGLTRPFTGVALGIAALALIVRLRLPARTCIAAVPPLLCAALVAASVARATTGSWTTLPWMLYARQYTPFDRPGLGPAADVLPERPLPEHLRGLANALLDSRNRHTAAHLPREVLRRIDTAARLMPGWALFPFALLGIRLTPLWPAAAFACAFFVLQLSFFGGVTFYHLDLVPWLALSAATGVQLALRSAARLRGIRRIAAMSVVALALSWTAASMARQAWQLYRFRLPERGKSFARWEPVFHFLRQQRALVFIHYPREGWNGHYDLTYNEPDLARAELVRAIDLGARDAQLMQFFPDRPAYRFDPITLELTRLR